MIDSAREQINVILNLVLNAYPKSMILPCNSCVCCIDLGEFRSALVTFYKGEFRVHSIDGSQTISVEEDEILAQFLSINPDIVYSPLAAFADGVNHEDHR